MVFVLMVPGKLLRNFLKNQPTHGAKKSTSS